MRFGEAKSRGLLLTRCYRVVRMLDQRPPALQVVRDSGIFEEVNAMRSHRPVEPERVLTPQRHAEIHP